jgi:hypothetical protein
MIGSNRTILIVSDVILDFCGGCLKSIYVVDHINSINLTDMVTNNVEVEGDHTDVQTRGVCIDAMVDRIS